jgi:hypothetical protein
VLLVLGELTQHEHHRTTAIIDVEELRGEAHAPVVTLAQAPEYLHSHSPDLGISPAPGGAAG